MSKYSVLFVDDEPAILSSLKRTFITEDEIGIFTAQSAEEGAKILKQENIDVVISDEKMPKIEGHKFLIYVKKHFPECIRIILTGFADANAIIEAINKGEVYRYLKKPWDNEELKLVIRDALKYKELKHKNKQMQKTIEEQNRKLKLFNIDLENLAANRNEQLKKALITLKASLQKEKNYLRQFLELMLILISPFQKELVAHTLRVQVWVEKICDTLNLTNQEEKNQILYAAYLHDIGLTGIDPSYFTTPREFMSKEESMVYDNHCALGAQLINTIPGFEEIAEIVLRHHTNYDDSVSPGKIPHGARIIRIADDYDYQKYCLKRKRNTIIRYFEEKNYQYDPELLPNVIRIIREEPLVREEQILETTSKNLKTGMYIMDDVLLDNKMLLLSSGSIIDEKALEKLNKFSSLLNIKNYIPVKHIQT